MSSGSGLCDRLNSQWRLGHPEVVVKELNTVRLVSVLLRLMHLITRCALRSRKYGKRIFRYWGPGGPYLHHQRWRQPNPPFLHLFAVSGLFLRNNAAVVTFQIHKRVSQRESGPMVAPGGRASAGGGRKVWPELVSCGQAHEGEEWLAMPQALWQGHEVGACCCESKVLQSCFNLFTTSCSFRSVIVWFSCVCPHFFLISTLERQANEEFSWVSWWRA